MLCCHPHVHILSGTHPRWSSELQQLSPSSLVQLLTASDSKLDRLQFLAAHSKQGGVAFYGTIVNMPERRFLERYPLFAGWAAGKK